MRRVFSDYAYGPGPRDGCWWDQTCDLPQTPELEADLTADVVVIGAGFTGLNAALTLAKEGVDVVVLDAQQPGFGASGRNGGFCCLGGGVAPDAWLDARFGKEARLEWRRGEVAAVAHVSALIAHYGWNVDRHSQGETLMAHRPMALEHKNAEENYGVTPEVLDHADLASAGMAGPFYGAITMPIGFALNPRKYVAGLLEALRAHGVRVFGRSPARLEGKGAKTPKGRVTAERVIVCTNGYSSETVPTWMAGRFMPVQSNVMVTRPLSDDELQRQGWTSQQMCYDTRNLLHYFRLMPDGRFLIGMRGGLLSNPGSEAAARRKLRRAFDALFPAWAHVETAGAWSGMLAAARGMLPFIGEIPGSPKILTAMCYHGNGVAMGSYAGHLVAQNALGRSDLPKVIRKPLMRFPLGRFRRGIMPPLYAGMVLADRFGRF